MPLEWDEVKERARYDFGPSDYISLDTIAYTLNDIGRRLDELERLVHIRKTDP